MNYNKNELGNRQVYKIIKVIKVSSKINSAILPILLIVT